MVSLRYRQLSEYLSNCVQCRMTQVRQQAAKLAVPVTVAQRVQDTMRMSVAAARVSVTDIAKDVVQDLVRLGLYMHITWHAHLSDTMTSAVCVQARQRRHGRPRSTHTAHNTRNGAHTHWRSASGSVSAMGCFGRAAEAPAGCATPAVQPRQGLGC